MNTHNTAKSSESARPRIALITNHGYAGVDIPVGGAPDTGGQNFYVNSLAPALEELGFEVTIFARGGFPFFQSEKIREGTEQLTDHVRYVYVPGGGDQFIRKEDIAIALDEETLWLERFIKGEAATAGVEPWDYYKLVNTHYWDAAQIAVKLVERWQNAAALSFLEKVNDGGLKAKLDQFAGEAVHRLGLSREIDRHLARITDDPTAGADLKVDGFTIHEALDRIDSHVWTPHSIGIIKERNYWNKDPAVIRNLKFRERDAHEQVICRRTPLFCSTSDEITRTLVSYHGVKTDNIFDFPPCIDARIFKPRGKDELLDVYDYLSKQSGVPVDVLRAGKIIFETSRMDRTKRKDLLLEAFAQVAGEIDDVYLFIGGGPAGNPIFKALEALKSTLPALDGRGFLLGFIPDEVIEPIFSVPDLFVSASEMEGFGMSVSQAAAAGVAVVSSDLIPFATQWAPDAAVVVKAGDVDGFARAMTDMLKDDEKRAARAAALLEIAATLDWQATARRFVDWFEKKHP